jgi:quercetin dioxygenase-like cupin family protein
MTGFPEFVDGLPELDIDLPGVSGRLLQAENHQVVFIHFAERTLVPEHSHAAQWELVVAGEVELTRDGETRTHRAGDSFTIPAGVPHGAVVHAGYRAVIVFDQADRYRAR